MYRVLFSGGGDKGGVSQLVMSEEVGVCNKGHPTGWALSVGEGSFDTNGTCTLSWTAVSKKKKSKTYRIHMPKYLF